MSRLGRCVACGARRRLDGRSFRRPDQDFVVRDRPAWDRRRRRWLLVAAGPHPAGSLICWFHTYTSVRVAEALEGGPSMLGRIA